MTCGKSEGSTTNRVKGRLRQAHRLLRISSGIVLWVAGVVWVLSAVFEFGLVTLSSEPRVFVFLLGVLAWAAGGLARGSQKKAARLERKLECCEDERDGWRSAFVDDDNPAESETD